MFRPGPRDQLRDAAGTLGERVDVLVAWGTIVAVAAKEARVSCPVVFALVGFPVAIGMVSNLRRPGGQFTGISFEAADETYGKRLQMLKEIVPRVTRIAALGHADDTNIIPALETAHRIAPALGIEVVDTGARHRAYEVLIVVAWCGHLREVVLVPDGPECLDSRRGCSFKRTP